MVEALILYCCANVGLLPELRSQPPIISVAFKRGGHPYTALAFRIIINANEIKDI
jgi:hypothetical protein